MHWGHSFKGKTFKLSLWTKASDAFLFFLQFLFQPKITSVKIEQASKDINIQFLLNFSEF